MHYKLEHISTNVVFHLEMQFTLTHLDILLVASVVELEVIVQTIMRLVYSFKIIIK